MGMPPFTDGLDWKNLHIADCTPTDSRPGAGNMLGWHQRSSNAKREQNTQCPMTKTKGKGKWCSYEAHFPTTRCQCQIIDVDVVDVQQQGWAMKLHKWAHEWAKWRYSPTINLSEIHSVQISHSQLRFQIETFWRPQQENRPLSV